MSHCTNSTMNRGVEAKEIEIANARLDVEVSNSTQWTAAGDCRGPSGMEGHGCSAGFAGRSVAGGGSPPSPDLTGSYLQVIVEKHKRKRDHPPAATSARLPTASSPIRGQFCSGCGGGADGGGGVYGGWGGAGVVVACPGRGGYATLLAPGSLAYCITEELVGAEERGLAERLPSDGAVRAAGVGAADCRGDGDTGLYTKLKKHKPWHLLREPTYENLHFGDDHVRDPESEEPECVEVYRFERVGAWLGAGTGAGLGGRRTTRVERAWQRAARPMRALAAEVGAAARLAVGAPIGVGLLTLRCTLHAMRDAAQGALSTLSDFVLKPALALLFNALAHPLLVFMANLLEGVRVCVWPVCTAWRECATHGALLLRACRLLDLHLHYPPVAPPPPVCDRCARQHGRTSAA